MSDRRRLAAIPWLRSIRDRPFPMRAWRQDLNHQHATLVTDWALPQRRVDEFFITLTIILSTFGTRRFWRWHVQKLSTVRQFLLSVPVGQEAVVADALKALRKYM